MGYTHYWHRQHDIDQAAWLEACDDVMLLLLKTDVPLAAEFNAPKKPPVCDKDQIRFNGIRDNGHETFLIARRVHPKQARRDDGWTYEFCKTERKPYDAVVCAVLAVLADRFGDAMEVRSDGEADEDEWIAPLAWASGVLGRVVPVPPGVTEQ